MTFLLITIEKLKFQILRNSKLFFSKVFEGFRHQDRLAKFKIGISSKEPLWPQWPPTHLKTPNQIDGNLLAAGQRKNKIITKMKYTEDNPMLGIFYIRSESKEIYLI